jgi:hypothetical protein
MALREASVGNFIPGFRPKNISIFLLKNYYRFQHNHPLLSNKEAKSWSFKEIIFMYNKYTIQ